MIVALTFPKTVPAILRSKSVRTRLALACALLIGAIALFVSLYFPARIEKQAIADVLVGAKSTAAITAYSLSAPLLFKDERAIADVLLAAREDKNLYSIVVRDEHGALMSAMPAPGPAALTDIKLPSNPRLVVVSAPVMSQGRTIGTVEVKLSLARLDAEISNIRAHIALLGIVIFIVGLVVVLTISNLVLAPLTQMVSATRRIAGGDLTSRAPVGSGDEFSVLAEAFNAMVDRLQDAHMDLTIVNRTLEVRIAHRTEQLHRESDERMNAEREQHRSEQRFRIMFESSPLGGVLFDERGRVLESNSAMRAMVGGARDNALTTKMLGAHLHHQDRRNAWRQFRRLMRGESDSVSAELRFVHATGANIFTHVTLSAVRDTTSESKLAIMMIENVTEQKGLEEQLRQSQKLEAVGLLAGGIAHDFNNLLTTINGSAELLLSDHGNSAITEDLRDIMAAGTRAAGLTAQLLAFSRRQVMQPKVLDVATVITDLSKLLRRLITESIRLELDLSSKQTSVLADPGQMEQVIMNLTINARDAMPNGGKLIIETDVLDLTVAQAHEFGAAHPGPHVVITVTDSGTGIRPDVLEHIFEPFYTTKEVGKGTGLGLATVYGILKQTGGGITVKSIVGNGTTFRIVLPALALEPAVVDTPVAATPRRGNETVLLVEDEEGVRSVLRRALQKHGYTVRDCQNGCEAMALFSSDPDAIDALVTDVVMPEMGGPEFVQLAKELRPAVKVLYMSGYAPEEVIHRELERESTLFIQKPVQLSVLMRTLRSLLDSTPTETAAQRPKAMRASGVTCGAPASSPGPG